MAWLGLYGGRARSQVLTGFTVISDADYPTFAKQIWRRTYKEGYSYVYATIDGAQTFLHRLIMGLPTPRPSDDLREVDHIDGDTLNNRRENLRVVTHRQNSHNLISHRGSSSKHRGVSWLKQNSKWIAYCRLDGHLSYLGSFIDEMEAARVASEFRVANLPFTNEDRRTA